MHYPKRECFIPSLIERYPFIVLRNPSAKIFGSFWAMAEDVKMTEKEFICQL